MNVVVIQARLMMVSSAQLRAARAYLDWTLDQASAASGLNRRTIIRLEREKRYAQAQPPSLGKLVAVYRHEQLILSDDGLSIAVLNHLTPDQLSHPAKRRRQTGLS